MSSVDNPKAVEIPTVQSIRHASFNCHFDGNIRPGIADRDTSHLNWFVHCIQYAPSGPLSIALSLLALYLLMLPLLINTHVACRRYL
jgi:hypothetical protein